MAVYVSIARVQKPAPLRYGTARLRTKHHGLKDYLSLEKTDQLATASADGVIKVWDLTSCICAAKRSKHPTGQHTVLFIERMKATACLSAWKENYRIPSTGSRSQMVRTWSVRQVPLIIWACEIANLRSLPSEKRRASASKEITF